MINTSIIIRRSGNREDTRVTVNLDSTTVEELKTTLENQYNIDVSGKRIIYNGIILRDEEFLSFYNLKKDSVLHLIQPAANSLNQPETNTMEDSGSLMPGLSSLKGNKGISSLLKAIDPEIISKMVMSNPQFKETMENNPEIGKIISDPKMIRQGYEMMNNPDKMREVMKNNDRAISNLEMLPGGFNHLKKIYETIQQPMESAQRGNDSSTESANRRYAEMYGVDFDEETGVNSKPLPNPWAPPPPPTATNRENKQSQKLDFSAPFYPNQLKGKLKTSSMFSPRNPQTNKSIDDLDNRFNFPSFDEYLSTLRTERSSNSAEQPNTSNSSSINHEELSIRFAEQIERLNEMGFDDLHQNLKALVATEGDVDDAVEFLLHQNS